VIDYSSIKFGYTNGKDFVLTGYDYTGYYHVINDIVYASKDQTDDDLRLTSKNTYNADVFASKFFKDRILQDDLTLPYTYNTDIQIAANETFNGRVFNDKLYKLYINSLYLYTKCFIASNDIPHNFDRAAGCLNDYPAWIAQDPTDATTFTPFSGVGLNEIGNAAQLQAIKMQDAMGYTFIGISPTAIIALSSNSDLTSLQATSINSNVDTNSDLKFLQLSSFSITGNLMYACDAKQNNVYKYDVGGFFNNDVTIANKRFLIESIGGEGNALAKTKFNAPDLIYANAAIDRVYVHDKGNKCIKIYDANLSYIDTRAFTIGTSTVARAFQYNETFKKVYIIVNNATINVNTLQICDGDLNIEQEYTLPDALVSGEYYKGLYFSQNDSNIMYIHTNVNVFKKFVNRPDATIGKWLFYKSGFSNSHIWNIEFSRYNRARWRWNDGAVAVRKGIAVASMSLLPTNQDADEIFVFAGYLSESFNRILHYVEPTLYTTVLGSTDFTIYSSNNLKVDDDEMIQAFVLNKELHKIINNTLYIKNYLVGRYSASYDYIGNLVNEGIVSLTNDEFNSISINNASNFYVHDNELASSAGTLNRVFKQIWDLQNHVLQITKTRINNFVPSVSGSKTVLLN
jgi:hypothetical protein